MKNYLKLSVRLLLFFAILSCKRNNNKDYPNSTPIKESIIEEIKSPFPGWFQGKYSQVFFNIPDKEDTEMVMIIPTTKNKSEIREINQYRHHEFNNHYIFDIYTKRNSFKKFKYFETIKIPLKNTESSELNYAARFFKPILFFSKKAGKQIIGNPQNPMRFSPESRNDTLNFKFKKSYLPKGFDKIIDNSFNIFLTNDVRYIQNTTKEFHFLIPCSENAKVANVIRRYDHMGDFVIDIYLDSSNRNTTFNKLGFLEVYMHDINFEERFDCKYTMRLFLNTKNRDDEEPVAVKVIDADIEGNPLIECETRLSK